MSEPRRSIPDWVGVALAACGVTAYLLYFFSLSLPNAPEAADGERKISRVDVCQASMPGFVPGTETLAADALRKMTDASSLVQRLPIAAYAVSIVLAAIGLGYLVLTAAGVALWRWRFVLPHAASWRRATAEGTGGADAWSAAERLVASYGLGLSFLSLMTLGLGLAGWLSRGIILAVLASLVLVVCVMAWRSGGAASGGTVVPRPDPVDIQPGIESRPSSAVLFLGGGVAVSLFLAAMFLGAMLPATDFDVREYHVQGPKEFYLAGRIAFAPHNVYMNMPFGTEMLTLLGMILVGDWWWGALVGQTVLATFAPMTAMAVWSIARRLFDANAAWLALLVYLTTPWIYRIAIIPYTENALCFYLSATLLVLVVAAARDRTAAATRPDANRYFLVAGLFAGSAAACKYPALISTVLPMGLVALAAPWTRLARPAPPRPAEPATPPRADRSLTARTKPVLMFALGAALTFGPWVAKNWIAAGNPMYPLLYGVFGGRDWSAQQNAKWEWGHRVSLLVALGVQTPLDDRPVHPHDPQHALTWRRLTENIHDVTAQADWLSPLLFGLAPLALFRRHGRAAAAWLWIFVAYLFLQWWLLTHRLDRFWVPLIPVVAVLAGAGATWHGGRIWRWFTVCVTAAVLFFNFSYSTSALCGDNRYNLELVPRMDPEPSAGAAINLMNSELPTSAVVLAVGAADLFHLDRTLLYNTVFDDVIFEQLVRGKSAAEAADAFRASGVTHVYVSWSEIARYRAAGSYGYSDFVTPAVFRRLVEQRLLRGPLPLGPMIELDSEVVPARELYEFLR